ncbi:hypothetical protein, partial [Lonepinella koalarum]
VKKTEKYRKQYLNFIFNLEDISLDELNEKAKVGRTEKRIEDWCFSSFFCLDNLAKVIKEYVTNNSDRLMALFLLNEITQKVMIADTAFRVNRKLYKNRHIITAKENRAKRKPKQDPNIEKARELAKAKWKKHQNIALMDMAYKIQPDLDTNKSITTIQEWIRDLNPKAKKKKTNQ